MDPALSMETGRKRSILTLITSTLRNVRGTKREARRMATANNAKRQKPIENNRSSESFTVSIASSMDSIVSDDESMATMESHDSLETIQQKAELLLQEMVKSLKTYTEKEEEVRKANQFHMDRAKGRYETGNKKGAVISMRRLDQLQREYQHINDAIQFFSFRKLEMDRFVQHVKTTLEKNDDSLDNDFSSLETHAVNVCQSLDDVKSVLVEPDLQESAASDEEHLKNLEKLLSSAADDTVDESISESLEEDEGGSSSYDDEVDESEFNLEDENLMSELNSMLVRETAA